MKSETKQAYLWSRRRIRSVNVEKKCPSVVVTDRVLALINASRSEFAVEIPTLLCIWHIEKNVLAKPKGFFESGYSFEQFL
jgi:hypothetical protein